MTAYIAAQFISPEQARISGKTLIGILDKMHNTQAKRLFALHGLSQTSINPDEWYAATDLNRIYKKVFAKGKGTAELIMLGKAMAHQALEAFQLDSIDAFIANINHVVLSAIDQTPATYGWIVKEKRTQHCHIVNNTDLPNDVMFGYLWEMFRLLTTPSQKFSIIPIRNYSHDSNIGAVFDVQWT